MASGFQPLCDLPERLTLIQDTFGKLRKSIGFEAIAVCGVSGLLVGGALSAITGIPLIVVRSSHSRCHSPFRVEGVLNVERYAILDDFVETGATIRRMVRLIREKHNNEMLATSVLTYMAYELVQENPYMEPIPQPRPLKTVDLGTDGNYDVLNVYGLMSYQ